MRKEKDYHPVDGETRLEGKTTRKLRAPAGLTLAPPQGRAPCAGADRSPGLRSEGQGG